MTAHEHLRITGPEDVLGFIPHSLGYWPAHSLVAMTLQGKRLGATLRVDLPAAGGSADRPGSDGLPDFARCIASYLEADADADGSLLALFTETDGDGTAWVELLAELEGSLADAGMPVRDVWIVGANYWRNAYCVDPSCCAPPGRPVEEIRNSRLNAEMVFRGSTVGAAPGSTDKPPGPVDPAVLEAEGSWARLFATCTRDRDQFGQVLDVWVRVLHAPGPVPKLPAALAGYLRASLCVPPWRDAVLVMAAAGREAAERGAEEFGVFDGTAPRAASAASRPGSGAQRRPRVPDRPRTPSPPLEGLPPASPSRAAPQHPAAKDPTGQGQTGKAPTGKAPTGQGQTGKDPTGKAPTVKRQTGKGSTGKAGPGEGSRDKGSTGSGLAVKGGSARGDRPPGVPGYGEVLLGLAPSLPDWTSLAHLERVLEQLGDAGGEAAAASLTGRGWIEWCRGRGSFADALFSRAIEEYPGYRLAELLGELGRRGTLCGWAGRREAAWQRFEPDVA